MTNEEEIARLRAALAWYADEENWTRTGYPDEGPISVAEGDGGARARVVLAGGNPL